MKMKLFFSYLTIKYPINYSQVYFISFPSIFCKHNFNIPSCATVTLFACYYCFSFSKEREIEINMIVKTLKNDEIL